MRLMLPIIFALSLLGGTMVKRPAAIEYDPRGQLSAWHLESKLADQRYYHLGLRYLPVLSINPWPGRDNIMDMEVSVNARLTTGSHETLRQEELELYRLKLRFATLRTETRAGLQKINFGPALLLRSLRWFDRLDPRDPLGLTEAVYALRFKYDSPGNAGLWLWALLGNDDPKGYEIHPSDEDQPEFGGRYQHPVPAGELAVSLHTRRAEDSGDTYTENRYALDGRWDLGIGLWLEAVWQQQRLDRITDDWQRFFTLGFDYTFGLGNGLHLLFEHQTIAAAGQPFGWSRDINTSAVSLNYFLGFLDNLSAYGYYSWDSDSFLPYASWQRTWDNILSNVSVFYNPESFAGSTLYGQTASAEGLGVQLILALNH